MFFCACFFMNFFLFAAGGLSENPGVEVLYYPKKGMKRRVSFAYSQMVRVNTRFVQLRQRLIDQFLDGYIFLPDIAYWKGNNQLLQTGVREHVCQPIPFFSENIDKCFSRMETLLQGSTRFSLQYNELWEPLTHEDIQRFIYPKGKTRRWMIVRAQESERDRHDDTVFVTFPGINETLKGTLCDVPENRDIKGLSSKCIRNFCDERFSHDHEKETSFVECAFDETLENCSGDGVGVVLFPERGGQARGIFDFSNKSLTMLIGGIECYDLSVADALCDTLAQGFVLRHPISDEFDADRFMDPGVRDAACLRRGFVSQPLKIILEVMQECFDKPGRCQQKKEWVGLRRQDFDDVCPEGKMLFWDVFAKEQLLLWLQSGKKFEKGTILILMKGQSLALQATLCALRKNKITEPSLGGVKATWIKKLVTSLKPVSN